MSVETDVATFMRALRDDPQGYETNRDLGLAMVSEYQGDYDRTIGILTQLFNLRPKTMNYLPELGEAFFNAGRMTEAADNSPEDIRGAVVEMLDRFGGTLEYSAADEDRQRRYKSMSDFAGFEGNARISADFLRRRRFLVEQTP